MSLINYDGMLIKSKIKIQKKEGKVSIIKSKILKILVLIIIIPMDNFEKKQQDYSKWDESIWLSVEKEISQFQRKVTESMLKIGQLGKTKIEDFKVEPLLEDDVILGQEFYLELIRPTCVTKGYLPKQVPTEGDLKEQQGDSDDDEDDKKSKPSTTVQQKKEQKPKQAKKGAKKGSKNNQKNNESQIKMKIIKQNFLKELDLVLNSHSLQRMQFEFGLKQKKLELRLITFFYIAYYIRKNKQKQKIQESEVFQLINILLKIVRIFDGFKGKSFFSGSADKKKKKQSDEQFTEVSPTLILDMKMCIKGLKEFYKYTNKKIIINYPKLVYYTNYDKFFPTLDIKPYPSQIQFIQAIKKAFNIQKGTITTPTLILYRTMIGSGKTSASLSLSNLINQTKLVDQKNINYQILYSCLIGSVRVQVGRYAYNNQQKFALAAMQKSIKDENYYYPRIINSFSCKNQKIVDLIISDLDCSYQMLDKHHFTETQEDIFKHERNQRKKIVNIGKLDKQNIVMFIDQPTAFCKDVNSPATIKLFNILANYPPKVIILASATMPPMDQLKNTIRLIEQRNPGLQTYQIDSREFQIGCQYCSFKGEIIFPHTNVKTKDELQKIINLVHNNPFLLRLYTGPSLYFLLKKCESANIKGLPKIEELPEIKQQYISKCTMRILNTLLKYDDAKIKQVCRLSVDEAKIDFKMVQKQSDSDDDIFGGNDEEGEEKEQVEKKEEKGDYVNFKNMLRQDAHKFLGGCLIGTSNPLEFAHTYFEKWLRISKKQPIKSVRRLLQKYQRQVQALQKQIQLLEDDDRRDDTVTKLISKLQTQKQPKMDFPDYKRINTVDHYNRYCKDKQSVHMSMLIKPMTIQTVAAELIEQVDDFILKLLFCGVALYMQKGLSPKYLDKVEELASQNYLAYIITDQSLCYGTNFPISNVILCDDLATKLNMNQMFQLIGRAGRVGQSWTARAFLEENGLEKLSQYIHSQDQKMSQQAEIFQKIAQDRLDNPELTLRTTKSEIKYVNIEKPDNRIEIIIKKKKEEDYHIFRRVALVPFLEDSTILVNKLPYQSINSYKFAQSDVLYQDLPTKPNSQNKQIIDVELYYKNQQQFIRTTLNNTCKRILKTTLQGKLVNQQQINQFKPKVYQGFFCMETNTFVILVKCKENVQIDGFQFQRLRANVLEKLDENLSEKIKKFVTNCRKFARKVRETPQSIYLNDVKQIKSIHEDIIDRQKTKFYKEIYNTHIPQITQQYDKITQKIDDKNSLETAYESKIILLVSQFAEIDAIEDKLFHVDWRVRKIWGYVFGEVQGKKEE